MSQIYEIEKIITHRKVGKSIEYYVKWKGFESKNDNTWEPERHLFNCDEILAEYNARISKKDDNNKNSESIEYHPKSKRYKLNVDEEKPKIRKDGTWLLADYLSVNNFKINFVNYKFDHVFSRNVYVFDDNNVNNKFKLELLQFIYAEISLPTTYLVKLSKYDALFPVNLNVIQSTNAIENFKSVQDNHRKKASSLHNLLSNTESKIYLLYSNLCKPSIIPNDCERLNDLERKRKIIDEIEENMKIKYNLWKKSFTGTLLIKSNCANNDLKEKHLAEYEKITDNKVISAEEIIKNIPIYVKYFTDN